MENIIKSMIEKAIYYKENLSLYDESRELLQFVAQLIEQMSLTINCPSNWRSIGTELAEEYKDNSWIFDELELWNYNALQINKEPEHDFEEICPLCDHVNEYKLSDTKDYKNGKKIAVCQNCGSVIFACNLCDMDNCDCGKCYIEEGYKF